MGPTRITNRKPVNRLSASSFGQSKVKLTVIFYLLALMATAKAVASLPFYLRTSIPSMTPSDSNDEFEKDQEHPVYVPPPSEAMILSRNNYKLMKSLYHDDEQNNEGNVNNNEADDNNNDISSSPAIGDRSMADIIGSADQNKEQDNETENEKDSQEDRKEPEIEELTCDNKSLSAVIVLPKSFVIKPEFNDQPHGSLGTAARRLIRANDDESPQLTQPPLPHKSLGHHSSLCSIKQINYRLYPTYKIHVGDLKGCGVVVERKARGFADFGDSGNISGSASGITYVLHIRFPVIKSLRTNEDTYASLICSPELTDEHYSNNNNVSGSRWYWRRFGNNTSPSNERGENGQDFDVAEDNLSGIDDKNKSDGSYNKQIEWNYQPTKSNSLSNSSSSSNTSSNNEITKLAAGQQHNESSGDEAKLERGARRRLISPEASEATVVANDGDHNNNNATTINVGDDDDDSNNNNNNKDKDNQHDNINDPVTLEIVADAVGEPQQVEESQEQLSKRKSPPSAHSFLDSFSLSKKSESKLGAAASSEFTLSPTNSSVQETSFGSVAKASVATATIPTSLAQAIKGGYISSGGNGTTTASQSKASAETSMSPATTLPLDTLASTRTLGGASLAPPVLSKNSTNITTAAATTTATATKTTTTSTKSLPSSSSSQLSAPLTVSTIPLSQDLVVRPQVGYTRSRARDVIVSTKTTTSSSSSPSQSLYLLARQSGGATQLGADSSPINASRSADVPLPSFEIMPHKNNDTSIGASGARISTKSTQISDAGGANDLGFPQMTFARRRGDYFGPGGLSDRDDDGDNDGDSDVGDIGGGASGGSNTNISTFAGRHVIGYTASTITTATKPTKTKPDETPIGHLNRNENGIRTNLNDRASMKRQQQHRSSTRGAELVTVDGEQRNGSTIATNIAKAGDQFSLFVMTLVAAMLMILLVVAILVDTLLATKSLGAFEYPVDGQDSSNLSKSTTDSCSGGLT